LRSYAIKEMGSPEREDFSMTDDGNDFVQPTKRKKLSSKQRRDIFIRDNAICHFCGLKIDVFKYEWEASHRDGSLWAGGSDELANLSPAHVQCHVIFTKRETTERAKSNRVFDKHWGVRKKVGKPIQGSVRSGLKKKMNGIVIDRKTGKTV